MIFKTSENALLLWLILCDFFLQYKRQDIYNQSEIGKEHGANFQNKMCIKFQKI